MVKQVPSLNRGLCETENADNSLLEVNGNKQGSPRILFVVTFLCALEAIEENATVGTARPAVSFVFPCYYIATLRDRKLTPLPPSLLGLACFKWGPVSPFPKQVARTMLS
jgi:hypothetical protein